MEDLSYGDGDGSGDGSGSGSGYGYGDGSGYGDDDGVREMGVFEYEGVRLLPKKRIKEQGE